ncbi:hypothetical protein Bho114_001220 [Bartonella sp. 114]|nr:hypothetical protein Bho114_001220 [Bartonella sp. 114]
MRIPPDFLDEIRARLPISVVIGQRVIFDQKKVNLHVVIFGAVVHFMVKRLQVSIVMIVGVVIIVSVVIQAVIFLPFFANLMDCAFRNL